MLGRCFTAASVKDGLAIQILHAILVLGFGLCSVDDIPLLRPCQRARYLCGTTMEGGAASHLLTPMSRSSSASYHKIAPSPNLNLNNTPPLRAATSKEGDLVKKKARKRKHSFGQNRLSASKRRRLGNNSSKSRKKEGALSDSSKHLINNQASPGFSVGEISEKSQVSLDRQEGAANVNLEEGLAQKEEDLIREDISKKSRTDGEIGNPSEVEARAAGDGEGGHPNNAQVGAGGLSKDLHDEPSQREQLASDKQDDSDKMVLRPRRQPENTPQRTRPGLREVTLCEADARRILGRKIRVYWPLDNQWYSGVVGDYDDVRKLHQVLYRDNDEEWLFLQNETFRLQVFPGETFGESAQSGETSRQCNGGEDEDGNAIGDNEFLSAFVKALANGSGKSIVSPQRTGIAAISKESASPASRCFKHDKHTLEALPKRGINGLLEGRKDGSTAEEHADRASTETNTPSRADVLESISGVAATGNPACVYVRRHSNRSKVRGSLAEAAGVAKAEEQKATLGLSEGGVRGTVARCDKVIVSSRRRHQQKRPRKASKQQALGADRKSISLPSIAQEEAAQQELQGAGVSGNVCASGATIKARGHGHTQPDVLSYSGHVKPSSSLDGHSHQASIPKGSALLNGKINLGHSNRKVSSDLRVLGTRVYPPSNSTSATSIANKFNRESRLGLLQPRLGISILRSKLDHFRENPRIAFHSTIHLFHPDVVVLDLFTWQLFNILKGVGLFEGDGFEGRFTTNGSLQDLVSVVRLTLIIIKTLPMTEWIHQRGHRHWQGSILHNLWNVLSGSWRWLADLPGILSSKAEARLLQHLQQFLSDGSSASQMTFRQMLNILVCYFIKPYVIATVCERGALLTVVIQRFLLPEWSGNSMQGSIRCVRQSVRSVRLRSGAGADSDFSSYLAQFPVSKDWRTKNGIFQKQMRKWIARTAGIGYAEQSAPVPSVKLFSHLGLQVTTARVFAKECATGNASKVFYLKQIGGTTNGILRETVLDSLKLIGEVRDGVLEGRFGFHINFCKSPDLFSGLFLTSMLQRSLHLAGAESLFPAEVSSEKDTRTKTCLLSGEVKSRLLKLGKKAHSQNHRRIAKRHKRISSQGEYVGGREAEPNQGFIGNLETDTVKRGQTTRQLEAGGSVAVRPLSLIADHNSANVLKNEGINGLRIRDGMTVQKTQREASEFRFANDVVYYASESPSNSSFESTVRRASTEGSGLQVRAQLNGDQFLGEKGNGSWTDPYYSHVVDGRKRKRKVPKLAPSIQSDVSHLQARRHGKRGRPRQNRQEGETDQIASYCTANLLITKGDRGWRESDVRVELQSNGRECLISVQDASGKIHTHKVQQGTLSNGKANRNTHAMTWKGGNGWILEFCDRKQWNLFKGMYDECGHRNARAASVKQIPIPGVRQLEDIDVVDVWRPPFRYICQTNSEVEAALKNHRIVYDLDSEDDAWLREVNEMSNDVEESCSSNSWITEEILERIMDKLEKVTYMREGEMVITDEAIKFCEDLGSEGAVRAVHSHWSKKRRTRGTALVRQFQPPLWKQYQKQVEKWQTSFNELQKHLPSASKEQLLGQCPRPLMFAFCLPPRGMDSNNISKKQQKQRSQKKISSVFKFTRAASLETPEESHRALVLRPQRVHAHQQLLNSSRDPDWHLSLRPRQSMSSGYKTSGWQRNMVQDSCHDQVVSDLDHQSAVLDPYTKAEDAQAKAAAARHVAGIKATKSQMQFLKFDSALQRAVAALIEFEAIQFAELAVVDPDTEACSPSIPNDQLPILKEKVGLLSSQFSNLLEKGSDSIHSSRDGSFASYLGSGPVRCDDGNIVCKIDMHTEELEEADSKVLIGDTDALLPMPGRDHLDGWMGTTLIQRTDRKGERAQHVS